MRLIKDGYIKKYDITDAVMDLKNKYKSKKLKIIKKFSG